MKPLKPAGAIHFERTEIAKPFRLALNSGAGPALPWTAAQDDILSDRAFDVARQTIAAWPGYGATPLVSLDGLAAEIGVASIAYKDEAHRFSLNSFKALGGAYAVARVLMRTGEARGALVTMDEIVNGQARDLAGSVTVCCATDGNHGRSVAWGAQTFGCRCVIFIHATVSEGRRDAIARFGAEVRRCTGNYDDSVREAEETARREGWTVVSDTSYPGYRDIPKDVMQGYELMAAEAFDALHQPPTHLFLQTGVGGMAAAIAAHAKRRFGENRPRIVLCDPDQSACWVDSFAAGTPTAVDGDLETLMAGLACGEISMLAWDILKDHGDAAMAVPDAAAVDLMGRLARPSTSDPCLVAGESAVAGLAGLEAAMADEAARNALGLDANARILIFGTEGDTDPQVYRDLVGMTAEEVRAYAD
ncbi:MAG: diaminopropionate ammonia-lyase [Pseudomonadota bacterium]